MTPDEIVRAITKQNWKLGGALEMDLPEAEALIEQAIAQARAEAIEECAKACVERFAGLDWDLQATAGECAAAIRSLLKGDRT